MDLLSFLSDDELQRYGHIARDQKAREWRFAALQVAAAAAAPVLLVAGGYALLVGWSIWTSSALFAAGVSAALWPLRRYKARRLWKGHAGAVDRELDRRRRERETMDQNASDRV